MKRTFSKEDKNVTTAGEHLEIPSVSKDYSGDVNKKKINERNIFEDSCYFSMSVSQVDEIRKKECAFWADFFENKSKKPICRKELYTNLKNHQPKNLELNIERRN